MSWRKTKHGREFVEICKKENKKFAAQHYMYRAIKVAPKPPFRAAFWRYLKKLWRVIFCG